MNLAGLIRKEPVWFVDTTLRDGEQAAGVDFSDRSRMAVASALWRAGVREMEVGVPASGEEARRRMRLVAKAVPDAFRLAWCRARRDDLDAAAQSEVQGVHLSFPVSDLHLRVWGKSRAWVLQTLRDLVEEAAGRFDYVTVGAQDASRADVGFLEQFCFVAGETAAIRLRLADTVGILTPSRTIQLVGRARAAWGDKAVEFHAHNDLGMATANTFTAWEAGAGCLSTTVNGLGERAGNAAFEEVVMAVEVSGKTQTGIRGDRLCALSRMVAEASGRDVPEFKAVSGEGIHRHESGIHVTGLKREALTYQAYPAEILGRRSELARRERPATKGGQEFFEAIKSRAHSEASSAVTKNSSVTSRRSPSDPTTTKVMLALPSCPEFAGASYPERFPISNPSHIK
jgi:homocitrate synthase NifV